MSGRRPPDRRPPDRRHVPLPAVFSLDVAAERRCPECSSEFVRKWRRGTNPADKICDTPAVVPGS